MITEIESKKLKDLERENELLRETIKIQNRTINRFIDNFITNDTTWYSNQDYKLSQFVK